MTLQNCTYAGLADERGYVQVGLHMVHVEAMRFLPVRVIADMTGVGEDALRDAATGLWAPLGLPWDHT